ncbi:MAG: S24 family peptidase [Saprospiraceae bacterium]|nr:S24 family peptidase [Saprospiraceae bacterium]MBK7812330.1 S24 family peptidase [Saprospiraceae bacterium]MBK9632447.1 S24 family peptidase [Saprospiraceae bacterium]
MNHIVSQRFINCFQELLDTNIVKSARQFAIQLEVLPQTMHEILKGRREVNIDLIQKVIEIYHFNPVYLFNGSQPKFLGVDNDKDFKILTILSDRKGKESIIHVPVTAQAGYPGCTSNPVFMDELPKFSLPDFKFSIDGTMRSFEVAGESMEPILAAGDLIISRYIHPFYWEKQVKSGPAYVIITHQDVLVKRITNLMRTEHKLILHSDNPLFTSYAIMGSEIKEIWEVCAKISTVLEPPKSQEMNSEENLKAIITKQTELLEQLLLKV